ncbi:MAG: class I mannose-6-phosphate isomerase [Lachnospiraceae bacterium]|nr:class I mannose-6-phosphate isomerase [Lachnospiraceae bacterium]
MSGFVHRQNTETEQNKEPVRAEGIFSLKPIKKEYIWGQENWLFSSLHKELPAVPFLIKEIVSREALSLQVHPGDEYAAKEEGSPGKTEMWYILDCQPDSFLYYGLKHRAGAEEIAKRMENGSILEICRKVAVNRGDVFFIPAGIIHAIGPGIRLLEVQQNSYITYRIYDYERKTADNQPRQLHKTQALQVSQQLPPFFGHEPMECRIEEEGFARTLLVQCSYFKVTLYEIWQSVIPEENYPAAIVVLEGEGKLDTAGCSQQIGAGETYFLTQKQTGCRISGSLKLVLVTKE